MPKLASKPLFLQQQQPSAPTIAPTTPASPPPSTDQPSWLTGPSLKAATEHLFATQRAKKASDRAKGNKQQPHSRASRSSSSSNTGTEKKVVWTEVWEAATTAASDDGDWPELPAPAPMAALQNRCVNEVPLAALVRPVKPRGARAKERTEFEFLPPVRNVIALDDADSNVPEEPWEYVSSAGGDDEARKIFSYAEIVSKSA